MKNLIILIFLLLITTSCSSKVVAKPCEYNIGHRVGGHLPSQIDNTIKAFRAATPLQSDKCFSNWELDVSSTKDNYTVLWHDINNDGTHIRDINKHELPSYVPTLWEFHDEMRKHKITKSISIDLKAVAPPNWFLVVDIADKLSKRGIKVRFVTNKTREKHYLKFCDLIKNKYKLVFYQGKGAGCQTNM